MQIKKFKLIFLIIEEFISCQNSIGKSPNFSFKYIFTLNNSNISRQGTKSEIFSGKNSRHLFSASNVSAIKLFISLVFIKLTNEKSRSTENVPNGNIIINCITLAIKGYFMSPQTVFKAKTLRQKSKALT